ncbi:PREDICTED: bcl-2-like protein 1 isoform X1 [Hipposideros armiger]|uniref:Bcl-2-like protein 1 isoform X1 n=1 Tax=Hipposideros armiger TaxID=186990 RepID=A0A8B7Q1I0_HIPAR|nr:PREDICTED: bcl-2-like protein 1 isoform X1 [Hipposideros armiger]
MSQSIRELVVDFLTYKLSQKGYSWSQFSDVEENTAEAPEGTESEMEAPSATNGNPSQHLVASPAVNGATGHNSNLDAREVILMAAVKQAMKEAGDEFELRYRRAFNDLASQLHITPGTAYQSFEQNGGWDTFVDLYGNDAAAERRRGQERLNRCVLMSVTMAAVVLLGLLFGRQ